MLKNSAAPPLHGEVSITCKKERHEGRHSQRHEGRQRQRHEGPHIDIQHEGPHNHIRHEGQLREFYLVLRQSRASRCEVQFLLRRGRGRRSTPLSLPFSLLCFSSSSSPSSSSPSPLLFLFFSFSSFPSLLPPNSPLPPPLQHQHSTRLGSMHLTSQLAQNILNFLPQPTHAIT